MGHQCPDKRRLFPGAPTDHAAGHPQRHGARNGAAGVECEVHHHEVGAMARTKSVQVQQLVKRATDADSEYTV